jgi:DNA topoisomerase-1
VDYKFTAEMEDKLDAISRGENQWIPLMKEFWGSFHQRIEEKLKIPRNEVVKERVLGQHPQSGKPVTVRMGRYGPMAQIGSSEDEEKPTFAGLQKNQSIETISLDEALKLFELPRALGESKDGETIYAGIGRYGPYIRIGSKFISIKPEDPYSITLERALEFIENEFQNKSNNIIKEYKDSEIKVLRGRYGPYIKSGKINARIPKNMEPENLSLKECEELVALSAKKKNKG